MLRLKLNHVSKKGPGHHTVKSTHITTDMGQLWNIMSDFAIPIAIFYAIESYISCSYLVQNRALMIKIVEDPKKVYLGEMPYRQPILSYFHISQMGFKNLSTV